MRVGGGGPPSPHSCHRPVTQGVIVPPHLDWIMGFWSVWALATHRHSNSWTPPSTAERGPPEAVKVHLNENSLKTLRGCWESLVLN